MTNAMQTFPSLSTPKTLFSRISKGASGVECAKVPLKTCAMHTPVSLEGSITDEVTPAWQGALFL